MGLYSIPGCGKNGTWYPYSMYQNGSSEHAFDTEHFGDRCVFGYKEVIPLFRAERFDPHEWSVPLEW